MMLFMTIADMKAEVLSGRDDKKKGAEERLEKAIKEGNQEEAFSGVPCRATNLLPF